MLYRTVPAKKRKVTFDPEIRPSSQAEPPLLPLAQLPSIVSKNDIQIELDIYGCKSILKNPPSEDRPYENLCNFLIEIPPPPSTDLLSLDILEQETVFRPKNRFGDLKDEISKFPKLESISSSDDEIGEDRISLSNEINEDIDRSTDSKPLETVITLKNLTDSKELYDPIPSEVIVDESDISLTDSLVPNLQEKNIQKVLEEIIEVDIKEIVTAIPDLSSDAEFNIGIDEHSEAIELCELESSKNYINLDRRKSTELESAKYIPEVEEQDKANDINPNIRKLDEDRSISPDSFEVSHKRNKLEDDISVKSNTLLSETFYEESLSLTRNNNNQSIHSDINITDIEALIEPTSNCDEQNLTSDQFPEQLTNSLVTKSPIQLIQSELGETDPSTNLPLTELTNTVTDNILIANPSTSNSALDSNKKTTAEETSEVNSSRHRRKSGRKGHRKHSHGSRSRSSQHQTTDNVCSNPNQAEQRALEAKEKFKRYLGRMTAKAMAENQNLNCAGEEETLEPHMVRQYSENYESFS